MVDDQSSPEVLRTRIEGHERLIAENSHAITNARQILELKMDRLASDISDLKNVLKWAGGIIVSLMLSFMGWAALQQYNANESQKQDIQQQLNILKDNETANKQRNAILESIQSNTASGTKTTVTPVGK